MKRVSSPREYQLIETPQKTQKKNSINKPIKLMAVCLLWKKKLIPWNFQVFHASKAVCTSVLILMVQVESNREIVADNEVN